MTSHIRQSNFEFLRFFSMFLVIWYHMFLFVFANDYPETSFYKAVLMPMHVGVPLFVLISGYFGIRFSFKSLGRLLTRLYFYAIPIGLFLAIADQGGAREILNSFLVIGLNKFWFINTYLCLYFIAPAITPWFDGASSRHRWVLMAGLAFMTFYVGDIKMSDFSLVEGKNLLNFIFLYFTGRMLHVYQEKLARIPTWVLISSWLLLASLSVMAFLYVDSIFIKTRVWALFYPYNSPMLLLESCILFLLFERMKFQSKAVNSLAATVLAMYILHGILWEPIVNMTRATIAIVGNHSAVAAMSFVLVILVMAICVTIDKCLSPLWHMFDRKTESLDLWYNSN